MTTANNKSLQAIIDNPCWGSPTQCSLEHLIQRYPREKSILFESVDYLVLNKPPDLRMDGAYPATVSKLLNYWYPPASLLEEKDLLTTVSKLDEAPKDSEIRPCHQLDYATSGILVVAQSRQAAAAATKAFMDRSVQKVYLAVVHGILEINEEWPILPPDSLDLVEQQETRYRQTKAKRRQDTFAGFQPVHSMFGKWKAHMQKNRSGNDGKKKHKRQKPNDDINLDDLWQKALAKEEVTMTDGEVQALVSSTWEQVKRNAEWKKMITTLTDLYNDALREKQEQPSLDLPSLFRIQGDADNIFYICVPLAQVDDDFAMRLPPNVLSTNAQFQGTPDLDYKPALTQCTILSCSSDTTKVQLVPKTGRRHQLRLHMVVAGHAIVGDVTYSGGRSSDDESYNRMCLHAHSISLDLLNHPNFHITAPDPFV